MVKIIVRSIPDVIDSYKKIKNGRTCTVFITKQHYNWSPSMIVHFGDVDKDDKDFINNSQIDMIKSIVHMAPTLDTLIVACDVGISRSPAVAAAIAELIYDIPQANALKYRYKHLNWDVYMALTKGCK